MTKKKIAIFTSSEGHYSISEAIKQDLQKNYNCIEYYERDSLYDIYTPVYQILPMAHQIPFNISKNKRAAKLATNFFRNRYQEKVEKFVKKHRPDICISTYFMYTPNLETVKEIAGVPFINVLTDPWTIHPLLVSKKANYNLAFDTKAKKIGQSHATQAKLKTSGWFVRDQFEESYDQKQVRKKLELDTDLLNILIVSGSEGTSMILKILPAILFSSKPIQVTVACGHNKTLQKGIDSLQKLIKKLGSNSKLTAIPFTKKIHLYMQAADLIVGKAGPNSLFEASATGTPFFAITHINGQEDGNLDIIEHYKLGYVQENLIKAQKLLRHIINHPEELQTFSKSIDKIAKHNQQSKVILRDLIKDLV